MELLPEETLVERIKRGAIPIDESLGIAKQIAEALDSSTPSRATAACS